MSQTRGQSGLTLIEVLIVIVLMATLAAFALPGSRSLIDSSQRSSQINNLLGFFAEARQSAIMTGHIHTLCPLDPDGQCGKDWNKPLHLFTDPLNERKLTGNTRTVRVLPPPSRGTLAASSLSGSYFQFKPNGMTRGNLGNLTWCPPDGDSRGSAHLILSRGGRIRLVDNLNAAGVPVKADGTPVNC